MKRNKTSSSSSSGTPEGLATSCSATSGVSGHRPPEAAQCLGAEGPSLDTADSSVRSELHGSSPAAEMHLHSSREGRPEGRQPPEAPAPAVAAPAASAPAGEAVSLEWDVLVAHYLGVDHAGHSHGGDSKEMDDKLHQLDEQVAIVAGTPGVATSVGQHVIGRCGMGQ